MKLNNLFNNIKLFELLIIIFPVCLLFSNLISELIIIFLIILTFYKIKFFTLKKKIKDLIFFILIFISIYLIFNYIINFEKDPSFSRSFFFIRFPLYSFTLFLILDSFNLNIKKIFYGWLIVSLIIYFDLFFQHIFGKNIFGYHSILQGKFYRLGGFLDDELKIANLIIHLFVPIFVFFHQNSFNKYKNKDHIFLFIYALITIVCVFLTGERSNFITLILFLFFYIMFTDLRKKFFILVILILPILFVFFKNYEPNLTNRMTSSLLNIYKKNLFEKNENDFFYKNNQYFAHYSTALEIGKEYPFFGVGLKNFRNYCNNDKYNNKIYPDFVNLKCSTHPHNFYFEIISETGFVGLTIFAISFLIIFLKFLIHSFKFKDNFLFGNTLILFIFFIPFLPKGSFFTNWNAMIFWTVFGLCLYTYKRDRQ